MDDKAVKCIFAGYNFESKGYRLYHPQTRHVLVSRDVVFVEDAVQPLLSCSKETNVSSRDMYDTLLHLFASAGQSHVERNEAKIQPLQVSNDVTNEQPITNVDVHDVLVEVRCHEY